MGLDATMRVADIQETLAGLRAAGAYIRTQLSQRIEIRKVPALDFRVDRSMAHAAHIEDLGQLGSPPSVIHGQHHLEAMEAMLRFPSVPALYVCHGWLPWVEAPPRFPSLLRYLAVDTLRRDRLVLEHGIPESRVTVLHNFVDLDRFRPREPLPPRPRRALLLSNQASVHTFVPAVERVLDSVRAGTGREIVLDAEHKRNFVARDTGTDVLGTFDRALHKMEPQLKRYKQKIQDHRRDVSTVCGRKRLPTRHCVDFDHVPRPGAVVENVHSGKPRPDRLRRPVRAQPRELELHLQRRQPLAENERVIAQP